MSRRKQSNPRQIKRPMEDGLEEEEGNEAGKTEELLEEGGFCGTVKPEIKDMERPCDKGEEDESKQLEEVNNDGQNKTPTLELEDWDTPRELEVAHKGGERRVCCRQPLPVGTTWGPFEGKIDAEGGDQVKDSPPVVLNGGPQWLLHVTWLSADEKNNCVVYSRGGQLWCTTTRAIVQGEPLVAFAMDFTSRLQGFSQASQAEGMYPARLLDSVQLLPQQAAMASILPTAIVNKDIFPCKTCGIWYRSERNLQAHLMYYCSGRQRDPLTMGEDGETSPHQVPCVCPFPQCGKRCSGPQMLEAHLSTHSSVKLEETLPPGGSLKCTICSYAADSLITFQHHVLSHLSQAAFRCNHCHVSFSSHREFVQHQDLHNHGNGKLLGGGEGEQQSPRQTEESQRYMGKKDILQSPKSLHGEEVNVNTDTESLDKKPSFSSLKDGAKASFSYTRIKSEPSSPRLASSPVQHNMGPPYPMGPFLSQFAFSQDISVAPQASEILAKMSELVHRRLRHGRNSYSPMVYNPLMPKGATCFECNITFNNLDNYLVHKKHYCNSRWQHMAKSHDYSCISDKMAETLSPNSRHTSANMLSPGHPSDGNSHLMPSSCLTPSVLDMINANNKVPEKELLKQVKKAPGSPGAEENQNGQHPESKSPISTSLENESDPSKTTCNACKITFSRHETYMVHKQFYCATRHDPPVKRAAGNKLAAMQRSMKSRKRRKMFELSLPDQDHMPLIGQAGTFGLPTLANPCTSQDSVENFGERFYPQCNVFPGIGPKDLEASLTVTKLVLASKCNQQEPDTPIDLSKKCSPHSDKTGSSPKRFLDYHECTVCKISFNKVESYLAHKQNFCPGIASQLSEAANLNKVKFPEVKIEGSSLDGVFSKSPDKSERSSSNLFNSTLGSFSGLHGAELQLAPLRDDGKNLFLSHCFFPRAMKKANSPDQLSPYYGAKATSYANGTLVNPSEISPTRGGDTRKDPPVPNGILHVSEEAKKQETTGTNLNGASTLDDEGVDHVPPNSPEATQAAKNKLSPTRKSEGPTEPSISPSQKLQSDEGATKDMNGSEPLVDGKYCQLCDLRFSSMSNFLTHKKFYCSSHSAEHAK